MTCTSSPFFFSFTKNTSFSRRAGGVLIFVNFLHLQTRSIPSSHLKLPQVQPKPRVLYQFHPPSATFSSSFAEKDNEPTSTPEEEEVDQDQQSEMARSFHISSATASAICICIAVATLTLPLAMKSLGQGVSLKIKALSYVTLLYGFYMARNIGPMTWPMPRGLRWARGHSPCRRPC